MVEVTEVDDYMSLFLVMNHSPDYETGCCKQYGLIYPFHMALYMESVMMFIKYYFVVVVERVEIAGQFVILVTVDKRDFHYLFRW